MPRPPRIHFPGALFHVMARGNGGQKVFLDDADHEAFLSILADIKAKVPFSLFAYCLMPNHFHLLVEVEKTPLSAIMQRVLARYSKHFNIKRKRFGHVFQARFKAILCQKDAYLLELLRYIHLNPVRAGLAPKPERWRWSGHREYLDPLLEQQILDVDFPLSLFQADTNRARGLYESFVLSAVGMPHRPDLYPSPSLPALGDLDFQEQARISMKPRERELPPMPKTPLAELARTTAKELGLSVELLIRAGGVRTFSKARRGFIHSAIDHGHRNADIAEFLKCSRSAVSQALARSGR